jgi:hypothetical protein
LKSSLNAADRANVLGKRGMLESETAITRRTGMNQEISLNEIVIEIEELESKIAPDQAATFID